MRVALRGGDIIAKKATTIAIVNQKGGTAKTTTCENLGIGLAMEGKKVLLVDVDPQGSLTISMGWQQPDELEQLLQTIGKVRRQINPKLKIEGILLTMTDSRTTYGKQIDNLIRQGYGRKINVFEQTIPRSVRAAEISAAGKSIFAYDPKGKVAEAYKSLTKEVLADADRQRKLSSERAR